MICCYQEIGSNLKKKAATLYTWPTLPSQQTYFQTMHISLLLVTYHWMSMTLWPPLLIRVSCNICTNKRQILSDPVTWAILAQHGHISFWKRDDPVIKNLPLIFGPEAQLVYLEQEQTSSMYQYNVTSRSQISS